MMRKMTVIPLLLLALAACGGNKEPETPTDNVKTSPEALTFTAEPQTLEIQVNAGEAFQAYCDAEWVKVDPGYSSAPSGTVKVTVTENMDFEPRTAEFVVKAGQIRHKVPITQVAATSPSIDIPAGYKFVWSDEFDAAGKPNTSEWWYETGGGGWGNNEIQNYVAQSYADEDLAMISGGTLKIKAQKIAGKI